MNRAYSFIVPVYNRPEETRELLQSMVALKFSRKFEVVIIEDGSSRTSEDVVKEFSEQLQISYYFKDNSGPGKSRNYGMQRAKGNYFLILDSDVILPADYLQQVDKSSAVKAHSFQSLYCRSSPIIDTSKPLLQKIESSNAEKSD